MSNLMIQSNCIKCGGCLGLGYSFLEDDGSGNVLVREGTYLDKDAPEINELKDVCPVGAFFLDTSLKKKSVKDQLEDILSELHEWKGIPETQESDMPFDIREYSVQVPGFVRGQNQYEYNSSSSAMSAAEDAFDAACYSKIDTYFLQVISEYRVKKLKPWFSMDEADRSVYVAENRKISKILNRAKNLLGDKLSSDFSDFHIDVSKDGLYRNLEKGEIVGQDEVVLFRREFDSMDYRKRRDYIDMEVETDSIEKSYTKQGLFGKTKTEYKDVYCYQYVSNACKRLGEDVAFALDMKGDVMAEHASGYCNSIIWEYNHKAQDVLQEKIRQIESCMETNSKQQCELPKFLHLIS